MTDQDFMVKVQERFPGHTITFPDAPLGPDDIVLRRGIAVDGRTIKVRWNNDVVDTVFQRHGLSIDDEVVEILCEAIQQSLSDPNFISEDRRTLRVDGEFKIEPRTEVKARIWQAADEVAQKDDLDFGDTKLGQPSCSVDGPCESCQ